MAEVALTRQQTPAIDNARLRSDLTIRAVGRVVLAVIPWLSYAFLWLPIIVLVVFSFNTSRTNAVWQGFTLDWYAGLLKGGVLGGDSKTSTTELIKALQNSLFIGFAAMIISTLLGTTVALGMERFTFRGRRLLDLLLYLPVVIPEITMGLSLNIFFSATFRNLNTLTGERFALSIVTVIIGHVVFCMPFVAIVVRARLNGMNRNLEEAARDLGANEWQTFRRVTLPLLMPGILAGALLALTLSLDDFVVTLFTNGPGSTTLPLYVQGLIKFGVNPSINAISTIIVCISMGLVLFSLLLQRNRA